MESSKFSFQEHMRYVPNLTLLLKSVFIENGYDHVNNIVDNYKHGQPGEMEDNDEFQNTVSTWFE